MTGEQRVSVQDENGSLLVVLHGPVDESFDFDKMPAPGSPQMTLDLAHLTRMNSIGIRGWVMWMRKQKDTRMRFRNCSRSFVELSSIYQGIIPKGSVVESVMFPWVCEDCNHSEEQSLVQGTHYRAATVDTKFELLLDKSKSCPKCGAEMDADVFVDKYFSFLKF
jgi:hypothetical protein